MLDYEKKFNHCNICKNEYTSKYILTPEGEKVYVCEDCQESTKYNFIWICFNCGKVYISPKAIALRSVKDPETLKKYDNMMVIQKLNLCTECNQDVVFNYNNFKKYRNGVHKKVSLNIPEHTNHAALVS